MNNNREYSQPERQILEATVSCIEKYGIDHLTIRKIAEEAEVNIASINYYFRSKEQLLHATMKMTITHMMEDVIVEIEDLQTPFEESLQKVFFYIIDGAHRFPGITTAHLYSAVIEKDLDAPGVHGFQRAYEYLVSRAMKENPVVSEGKIRFYLSEILSAILFSALTPSFFSLPASYSSNREEDRMNLASEYAHLFFTMIN
jgi:AcrR family transcriptional regulator